MSWSRMSWPYASRCISRMREARALCRLPPALLLLLALSACSSGPAATQVANWAPTVIAPATSSLSSPEADRPQVEIEGDGLEGQLPPRRSTLDAPDDPTEPFSPNYGSVPAPVPTPVIVPEPV